MRRPTALELRLDVLEEHVEDLGFLWAQRHAVLDAADWSLEELTELEARADAHRDAAKLAAPYAAALAKARLRTGDAATACGCAMVLVDASEPAPALAALAEADAPVREGVRLALRDAEIALIDPELRLLSRSDDDDCAWRAADVLAFRGLQVAPRREWFESHSPEVRAGAWSLISRAADRVDDALLARALADDDEGVRWSAFVAAIIRTARPASALEHAVSAWPRTPVTLRALSILGGRTAWDNVLSLASSSDELTPAALVALAGFGRTEAVPVLMARLDDEVAPLARTALQRLLAAPTDRLRSRALAEQWWGREHTNFDPARRWQIGIAVDVAPISSWFPSLALAWRRDAWLAAKAAGRRVAAVELEGRAATQRTAG